MKVTINESAIPRWDNINKNYSETICSGKGGDIVVDGSRNGAEIQLANWIYRKDVFTGQGQMIGRVVFVELDRTTTRLTDGATVDWQVQVISDDTILSVSLITEDEIADVFNYVLSYLIKSIDFDDYTKFTRKVSSCLKTISKRIAQYID